MYKSYTCIHKPWEYSLLCVYNGNVCIVYCVELSIVYCLLCKCVYCVKCVHCCLYIVNVSYLVACTAMAQSFVPKNFTISTLVYMMCDNKEIWFDLIKSLNIAQRAMLCILPPSPAPPLLSNGINSCWLDDANELRFGPKLNNMNAVQWGQGGAIELGFGPDNRTKCESTLTWVEVGGRMVSAGINGVEEAGRLHRPLSMFTPGWTCKQNTNPFE